MSRAVVIARAGGPEVLSLEDRSVGDPGPGEIKLRQTAIGLNFIDTYQRSGLYPVPMPFIGGNEGAGEVVAVGADVTDFRPGDRVAYQGALGAYAQERLLPAAKAVIIPRGVDDATAAASMLKGLTAYYLLFQTWAVQPGETILWHAAAGGTGQIATQWAKSLGATVIGTVGSQEKASIAKVNGCDHVINYREQDFAAVVRDITGGRGVDVVYDGVGNATFEKSLDCLRPRGLMVSFGNASGIVSVPDLGVLARKGSLFVTRPTSAHYFPNRPSLLAGAEKLFAALAGGAIKVDTSRRFALDEVADAHRALEGRDTTGSVLLIP